MSMQVKDVWAMVKESISEFFTDKAQTLAAALAIYTMLSIAPLLVIVTKIAGVKYKDAPQTISKTLTGVIPGMDAQDIEKMIVEAGKPGEGRLATIISVVLVILGATGVFGQLQDSMNTIWEVKPKPNQGVWGFIRTRFLSFGMVLGIAFLFMVSTVGTTLVTTMGEMVAGKDNKVIAAVLAHAVSLVIMWGLFALIFKVLPDAKTGWKDCLIGAAATAVLFELGKVALGLYLEGSSTKLFGQAASLAAMLLFIFYSAQIMFLGAEFTQSYAKRYGAGIKPNENAVKVTEDDRAEEGRPHEGRVAAKTKQAEGKGGTGASGGGAAARPARARTYTAPQIPAYSFAPTGTTDGKKSYLLAGAGVVVGALAGALGAKSLLNDPFRPTRKHIQAVALDRRLSDIEQKVGRVSRIQDHLRDADHYERINRVAEQIRHARTAVRAGQNGRPGWLVRLGDLVAGNR